MNPSQFVDGRDLRIAALEGQNKALSARVVALETALEGVLSVIERPQSGPTICMSAEDAINSAANGLDLSLAALGAREALKGQDDE